MSTAFPSLEGISHYDAVLHVSFWTSSTPILALELEDFPVHYYVHIPSYIPSAVIIFAFVSVICGLIQSNLQFVFGGVCNVGGRGTRTIAARTMEP